jgi:hypothetical protein
VTRYGRTLLGLLLAGEAAGCLLYTDRINHAPTVVVVAPAAIEVDKGATYSANARDPDQGPQTLMFEWWLSEGRCGQGATRSGQYLGGGRGVTTMNVTRSNREPFCVSVFVSDDERAEGSDRVEGHAGNQPPVARIALVPPVPPNPGGLYPLYSTLRLAGTGEDPEGDALVLTWSMQLGGVTSVPLHCPGSQDVCISLDQPGPGSVSLTADDGGMKGMATLPWTTAEDRPPCITHTTPDVVMGRIVHDTTKDGPLVVSLLTADDDGDPYPPSRGKITIEYRWDFQPPDQWGRWDMRPEVESTANFPVVSLEPYRTHDFIVRLTYHDRTGLSATCREADPFCGTPACWQRVTWTITIL